MASLRQLVDPPTFTPLSYGLLSVIEQRPSNDAHWQSGVTWQSVCNTPMGGTTYDECITVTGAGALSPPAPTGFSPNVGTPYRGATPFTVYADFECSPVGIADAAAKAKDALARAEPYQIERAFWSGLAGGQTVVFPHLSAAASVLDPNGVTLQSAPVTGGSATTDVVDGLGILEGALADCYNGVGVIHIPQAAAATFDAWGLLKTGGPRLRTMNGNFVAIGAGYPGTSPAGVAPAAGTTWIYATGPIFGYRGDVRVANLTESMNRAENTVTSIAQRTVVLGFDCCHVAVQVAVGVAVT